MGQVSYIPSESEPLRALAQVNQELVQTVARRCADQKIATVDLDATVIESWKREAKPTYEGCTGYQPMLALWAEMDLVVADEFRDGNVGAQVELLGVTQRALAALPETVEGRYFRGDAACYEQTLLKWLRNGKRENGPEGFIGFAVSARMSESLKAKIGLIPEAGWRPYREDAEVICECAELPWDPVERKTGEVLDEVRYLAIRVRRRQGVLFEDGMLTKHFAVVTNRFDFDAKRLLEWHREKAGSIEALHHVLKNELAAGVMPCARFGANAAWLRLAVITHNVLTGLKRIALPPEYLRARPKRLRFQIFCSPGTLVHHARQLRGAGGPAAGATAGVGGSLGVAAVDGVERSAYGRIIGPLFEMLPAEGVLESASRSVGERVSEPFSSPNHAAPPHARCPERRLPVSAPADPLTPPVTDGLRTVDGAQEQVVREGV